MGFITDFIERGYYYQCSDMEALKKIMSTQKIAAYIGFDCTARSLHVGNLMQIMILRLLQQHGHKPIVVVGGATSRIGDPTGKNETRKVLSDDDIAANTDGIKKSLSKFIKFGDGPSDAIMLDNNAWLGRIGYMDFLRHFGGLISVNRMLSMESAKLRLSNDQSLSFLEFNYMILQGYDFYHLHNTHNCVLQIGGSDQWGNIIMGVDIIGKALKKDAFALTTCLLTTSSGTKMGKSVSGAVWINDDMLSSYDYFQFWRNTEDSDVVKFAKLYTEWTDEEMQSFEHLTHTSINDAKKQLAHRLTAMCHGEVAANDALETARKVFEEGSVDDNLPTYILGANALQDGITAYELIFNAGLTDSKSEARKLIRGGGARINDIKIEDESAIINKTHLTTGGHIKLSLGKKKHILVKEQ